MTIVMVVTLNSSSLIFVIYQENTIKLQIKEKYTPNDCNELQSHIRLVKRTDTVKDAFGCVKHYVK